MTTRQLEPTPGWCERAFRVLCSQVALEHSRDLIFQYRRHHPDIEQVQERLEEPAAPEPLPHEFVTYEMFPPHCRYCGILSALGKHREPCPARRSSAEPAKHGKIEVSEIPPMPKELEKLYKSGAEIEAEPAAKDAELPEELLAACKDLSRKTGPYSRNESSQNLCVVLLAESRRIAREELAAAKTEQRFFGIWEAASEEVRIRPGEPK